MTRVADRLRATLGAESVGAGEQALGAFAVDGRLPAAVVYPDSPEQVAAVLAECSAERWGVIPWGRGSGIARGNVPVRYDVALSLSRLADVADHDVDNLTLTAAAGLTVAEANRRIAAHHQLLAIDFAEAPHTLGGCIAAARLAPKRLLYGELRDQLLGLRVALPDGTLVRYGRKVLKNVAGYDMNKLFLGSQGMLGVVVEATFKLFALPDEQRVVWGAFAQESQALLAAERFYGGRLLPAFLLLLDAATTAQAQPGLPPPAEGTAWTLLTGFEGRAANLTRQRREARTVLDACGAQAGGELPAVTEALRTVLERPAAAADAPAALRLRVGCLPSQLARVLPHLREGLRGLRTGAAVQVDYGAGQVLVALSAPDAAGMATLPALVGRWRQMLELERGFLVVEDGPPELKDALETLGIDPGEARLIRMLKRRFDPDDVMAPGRYLEAAP